LTVDKTILTEESNGDHTIKVSIGDEENPENTTISIIFKINYTVIEAEAAEDETSTTDGETATIGSGSTGGETSSSSSGTASTTGAITMAVQEEDPMAGLS